MAFLLKTHQFLAEVVHSGTYDGGLKGLGDTVNDALLVGFNELGLIRVVTLLAVVVGGAQLGDQIETLLLAFEHHILHGTAFN